MAFPYQLIIQDFEAHDTVLHADDDGIACQLSSETLREPSAYMLHTTQQRCNRLLPRVGCLRYARDTLRPRQKFHRLCKLYAAATAQVTSRAAGYRTQTQ